eukprot:PITA_07768
MGRSPWCSKQGLNRGAWTRKEDMILSEYIRIHGDGRWTDLPRRAGLKRCGKSCRLRWINYLRPDIKRGNISPDEEDLILRMHRLLGNRWSLIAGRLPGRTDNEIKNYWNTRLNKRLLSIKNCQPKSRAQNLETNSKSGDNHVFKTIPVRITATVRYSEMVRSKRCNGYDRSNCRSDETFKLFNVTENASSVPHDDVGRVSFVMAEDNLPENHCNANGCTNYCSSDDAFKLCNVKENTNSITSVDSEHIALAMADVNLLETEDANCSSSIWSLHEERAPQSYYFAGDAATLAEGLSELNVLSCPDCTLFSTVSESSTDLELEEFFREPATLAMPINNFVFT